MDERTGRALLRERFTAAGLTIQEDFPFREGTIAFSMDGYDPARRIGYEYITTEAGDREELTPALLAELEALMARGQLHVLLVDEHDVDNQPAALTRAADRFLAALAQHSGGRP